MNHKAIEILKRYSGKRNVLLTQRGNKSILLALKIAKSKGIENVVVQDQGGWITYLQYPEKLGMKLIRLRTDLGIIDPNELSRHMNPKTVLLVNSLSGYFAEQPMGLLSAICKQKNGLMINDSSGSIGTELAKFGDIIIGSFGEGKPVNLEYGGFIAVDDPSLLENVSMDSIVFDKDKEMMLLMKLQKLPERLRMFEKHHRMIKKDLGMMKIIHADSKGINVVIAFRDKFERERVINYCSEHGYQYTECPRYVRVNTDAISIEVKRLRN